MFGIKIFPDHVTKTRLIGRVEKAATKNAAKLWREIRRVAPEVGCFCNTNQSAEVLFTDVGDALMYTCTVYVDCSVLGGVPMQQTSTFTLLHTARWREELKKAYTKAFEKVFMQVDPVFVTSIKEETVAAPLW